MTWVFFFLDDCNEEWSTTSICKYKRAEYRGRLGSFEVRRAMFPCVDLQLLRLATSNASKHDSPMGEPFSVAN
jgi:hypothetical protein